MSKRLRVLVCGSRHWTDKDMIYRKLDEIYGWSHRLVVIEGGCPRCKCHKGSADYWAGEWAGEMMLSDHDVEHWNFAAHWAKLGKSAGPIRNRRMLEHGEPQMVLAFHYDLNQSKGTADMVRIARDAGVSTTVIGDRHASLQILR